MIDMRRTFKFRIYPSRSQMGRLNRVLMLCCELYNAALQERRDAYQTARKSINYFDQAGQLSEIRKIRDDVRGVYSQVLQDVLRRIDRSFDAFFRRLKNGEKPGYPRFKGAAQYNSLTYTQSGFGFKDGKLSLSKIGNFKIKLHRPVEGRIKTLTIIRSATNKWYACLTAEIEKYSLPRNDQAVGIDVGLTTFAALSTGEKVENPRFFRIDKKALAKAQRQKHHKIARRIHERIKFRRNNFAHQLSYKLVRDYGAIFFEDLNIQNMVVNHILALSIADAAWGQLIQFTAYKAENAGRRFGQVDPRGTSQECSACGEVVYKDLSERIHRCMCGLTLCRDINAARNILSRGLATVGLEAVKAA